jgi:hypothetical protein
MASISKEMVVELDLVGESSANEAPKLHISNQRCVGSGQI